MAKRKLEDLNLLDNFLFGSMVTHPELGESFVRELLQIIFNRQFGKLIVVPQKVYYGTDTDIHGARLDVYLEEPLSDTDMGNSIVYDLEPDKNSDIKAVEALPRRVRFYHAKIDGDCLQSGKDYENLKNVTVVFISPYDPFGENHMIYTIRNMCEELPSLKYDDGARTIFLYTKGTEGNPPKEISQLLHYMEHTTTENAVNDSLKNIDQMVNTVKHDKEVSLSYMKMIEWEKMLIRQGREEERANIERERLRADSAEERADFAEKQAAFEKERANYAEQEIQFLKKQARDGSLSREPL